MWHSDVSHLMKLTSVKYNFMVFVRIITVAVRYLLNFQSKNQRRSSLNYSQPVDGDFSRSTVECAFPIIAMHCDPEYLSHFAAETSSKTSSSKGEAMWELVLADVGDSVA